MPRGRRHVVQNRRRQGFVRASSRPRRAEELVCEQRRGPQGPCEGTAAQGLNQELRPQPTLTPQRGRWPGDLGLRGGLEFLR